MKTIFLELPVSGKPDSWPAQLAPALGDFSRSDHWNFWKADMISLFNTDTANFRGVMRRCYHEMCDHPSQFSYESYGFLAKHIRALVSLSKDKCGECGKLSYNM